MSKDLQKKDEKPKLVPGLGITREQLISYLKGRKEQDEQTPSYVSLLYDVEDWMNEGALITENTPRMIMAKIRMKVMLAASDPTRTKPLIQVFLEEYNREMVGLERKGRLESLGALQSLAMEGGEERSVRI